MKFLSLLFFIGLLTGSCVHRQVFKASQVQKFDGKQLYVKHRQAKDSSVQLSYYGDYRFHKARKKKTPYLNKQLMKAIGKGKKSEILFAVHTYLDPYCSGLALRYQGVKLENVVQWHRVLVERDFKAKELNEDVLKLKKHSLMRLTYTLIDKKSGKEVHYVEYYWALGADVFHHQFWTLEPGDWLIRETEGVMESLRTNP